MSDTTLVSLAEALTARSSDDVLAAILAALAAKGVNAAGWPSLSLERALLEIDSPSLARQEQIRATLVTAGFLDTAAIAGDDWLDLCAKGVFYITRSPATKAAHTFRLTNTGAAGPFSVQLNTIVAAGKVLFRNVDQAGTVPAGVGQYVDLRFVADVAGVGGNIAAGTSLSFAGSGLPGVTVTNPAIGSTGTSLIVAGADAEPNASVKARCRGRWAANSVGGGRDAFATWIGEAFEAAGLTNTLTRIKVDDTNPNGPGSTDIYCASASAPATSDELAIASPYILDRQTTGTGPWRVLAATAHVEAVVATLFASGNPSATTDGAAALAALQATTALGATLYRAELVAALMGVAGVYNVTLGAPAADVMLGSSEALVLSPTLTLG